jgi:hypothetical protein
MPRLFDRVRNAFRIRLLAAKRPRSENGASSFHAVWEMPAELGPHPQLTEVSAVLEVLAPPRQKALYFWALQVDLVDARGKWGVGHTGLQWNPRYPGRTAVNWGGYASVDQGGVVLPGTQSLLPGFSDDPNTLSYPWRPNRPYRIRVHRSPETEEGWRVEVTDLVSGRCDVVRDVLPAPGRHTTDSYLANPFVWSEVFAAENAPSVVVRWSDLKALDRAGAEVRPQAVRVNYQAYERGGYSNTDVRVDETGGVLQVTKTSRMATQGASLPLSGPAASC